jgi:cell division protein FtsZ
MVFITCGLGGGTGTGASSVIAEISKELGSLTVAIATKPFVFEGKDRMSQAEQGVTQLKSRVDSLITIPNQRLLSIGGKHMTIIEAFLKADEVLLNAVRSISDLIVGSGHVVVDFADVKTIMSERGMAIMGIGEAKGENRAREAAQKAISSPLLEDISIHGARGVLINVTGNTDMTLHEVYEASSLIQEQAHEDAKIIWGLVYDEGIGDSMRITVIATGFEEKAVVDEEPAETMNNGRLFDNEDVPLL